MMSLATDHSTRESPAALMAILKHGTADVHREIEAAFPLMRPDLTLERYLDVLVRLYAIYYSLEKNYRGFSDAYGPRLNLDKRRKADLLASDLKALGLRDDQIEALRPGFEIPSIATIEDLIGTLYVVEGSTLGGQVIQAVLKRRLKLTDDQLHFFNSYGSETHAMWQEFRATAEALIERSRFDDVLTRARLVFSCMTKVLSQPLKT